MSKIEYLDHNSKNGTLISVVLDKKIVGCITNVQEGFRYCPHGHSDKFAGEIFKTIKEVKDSLG